MWCDVSYNGVTTFYTYFLLSIDMLIVVTLQPFYVYMWSVCFCDYSWHVCGGSLFVDVWLAVLLLCSLLYMVCFLPILLILQWFALSSLLCCSYLHLTICCVCVLSLSICMKLELMSFCGCLPLDNVALCVLCVAWILLHYSNIIVWPFCVSFCLFVFENCCFRFHCD